MEVKRLTTVWVVYRHAPECASTIWAICDDEYSARKVLKTLLHKEEFEIFPFDLTHIETERKID